MSVVGIERPKVNWPAVAVVAGIHVMALAALVPWLFSWTGVCLALAGCYVFGTLGINMGFHRLLTHRSFKCPLWFEHGLALLGVCCLEKSPGQFVATHRAHHQHEDNEHDPHSPLASLFWGHMGWLFVENKQYENASSYDRYARDVFADPFYFRMERNVRWLQIYIAHALLFYAAGFAIGLLAPGGSLIGGVQFGSSLLVWGVLVRTVLVWHITWSVNSIGHVWGYKTYATRGNSRNSILIGLLSNGDGWHNNHHADQRAASHGHKWWEFDVTYVTLIALRACGLAWDLVPITVEPAGVPSAGKAIESLPVDAVTIDAAPVTTPHSKTPPAKVKQVVA
jgi:stearoyl-CoA desaturase (delta-9 desaturase)